MQPDPASFPDGRLEGRDMILGLIGSTMRSLAKFVLVISNGYRHASQVGREGGEKGENSVNQGCTQTIITQLMLCRESGSAKGFASNPHANFCEGRHLCAIHKLRSCSQPWKVYQYIDALYLPCPPRLLPKCNKYGRLHTCVQRRAGSLTSTANHTHNGSKGGVMAG